MYRSPPEVVALTPAGACGVRASLACVGQRWPQSAVRAVVIGLGGFAAAAPAWAQAAAPSRAWLIQPSVSVSQTLTNNLALSAIDPLSDAVTRLTAGVAVQANAGAVRGFLDYTLSGLVHARHPDRNTVLNSLTTVFGADLVPGRAKLDVSGTVSRSAISAFGAQPGAGGGVQGNATELRQLRVAPSAIGPLGSGLRYSTSLSLEASDAKDSVLGDSTTANWAAHVEPTTRGAISWSVDGALLRSDFKAGRATSDDRLFASARWRLDNFDTVLTGSAGLEVTDMTTPTRQRFTNWGLGATWTPSPRTSVSAQYDDRFFGPSRRLSLDHRTALTSWHLGKSRSLSTNGGGSELSGRSTAFQLLDAQFSSAIPDAVKRAEFVTAYLQSQGFSPTADPGFLRASVLVQDLEEISFAMRGVRSTAVLRWTRTRSTRLGTQPGIADDLAVSSQVNLQGLALDLTHRLTPHSSAGLVLSDQRGSGLTANQNNHQRRLSLRYSLRPSANIDASVIVSRALYDSFPAPYGESAVIVTLGYRF